MDGLAYNPDLETTASTPAPETSGGWSSWLGSVVSATLDTGTAITKINNSVEGVKAILLPKSGSVVAQSVPEIALAASAPVTAKGNVGQEIVPEGFLDSLSAKVGAPVWAVVSGLAVGAIGAILVLAFILKKIL